jgi:hypothetical protein
MWSSLVDRLRSSPFDEDILYIYIYIYIYIYMTHRNSKLVTKIRPTGIDTSVNVAYLGNGSSYRDETSGLCSTLCHR